MNKCDDEDMSPSNSASSLSDVQEEGSAMNLKEIKRNLENSDNNSNSNSMSMSAHHMQEFI
jgi:hypothetical protein